MWMLVSSIFGKKCEFCKKSGFRICPNCLPKIANLRNSQDGIPYFLSYQDEKIRKLIWKFKYKNELTIAHDLAPLIGDFIYEQIENDLSLQNMNIYIVPAPITNDPTRYRLKNHMLVMANEVRDYLKKLSIESVVCDCLKKSGHKRSAMIYGKKKRISHIEKALQLKSTPPQQGLIFIIDDVTTTGTTFKKIEKLIYQSQNLSEKTEKNKGALKKIKAKAFVRSVALAH
jgi:predicted amidophosphoribosyltransferase